MTAQQIERRMREMGNQADAEHALRFFKTGKGEYGEGDQFLGIRVPVIRKCVREYRELSLDDVLELLKSPYHEIRQMALLIMVAQYSKAKTATQQKALYQAYLKNTAFINNWDLVDCSAEHVVGAHLYERDRKPIYRLVRSKDLWERRISVLATFHFIKKRDFADTLALAEQLLNDREDLMHKAVGWMLREVGNRGKATEERFLDKHYQAMPRTMLRYAIEKFPEEERQAYLKGTR